ncbi:DUF1330 domain-containing protein [Ahrensia marina]|uniref:DUF1330 domain-containing protein n=1 Tax=Ahrensia marina TaxID=1514904 RepID=UPI0035CEDEF7
MADYFVVVDVRIDDPVAYKRYADGSKPIIERCGGSYLVRGGAFDVLEGDYYSPRRLVLLRFPSREDFDTFYNDPEYRALREERLKVSDMVLIGVEGFTES